MNSSRFLVCRAVFTTSLSVYLSLATVRLILLRARLLLAPCLLAPCLLTIWPRVAWADSYDEEETDPESDPDAAPVSTSEEEGRLSAGGLEAPGNFRPDDAREHGAEQELEDADRRDSGRGLEFAWLVGGVGLAVIDVAALDGASTLAPGAATGGAGVEFGGGLGVRLLYFTAGARIRGADVGVMNTWSVLGELGIKFPIGNLEPFALVDVGYAAVEGLFAGEVSSGLRGVSGLSTGLSLGADYYLSNNFSLGAEATGRLYFLGRPAQDPSLFSGSMDPSYASGASSTGAGFALTARIGFHY